MMNGSQIRQSHRGFAYVLVLASVAVIGMSAAASVMIGQSISRRSAEVELLDIGDDFRRAFDSYRSVSGTLDAEGPRELRDLLKDPRTPGVQRHIRRIPVDPITGKTDWIVVRNSRGLVVAVHSASEMIPIKNSGFNFHQASFQGATRYADWVFASSQISDYMLKQSVREVSRPLSRGGSGAEGRRHCVDAVNSCLGETVDLHY